MAEYECVCTRRHVLLLECYMVCNICCCYHWCFIIVVVVVDDVWFSGYQR